MAVFVILSFLLDFVNNRANFKPSESIIGYIQRAVKFEPITASGSEAPGGGA